MSRKHALIYGTFMYLNTAFCFAISDSGFSSKTKPIEGHAPYISSISGYQDNKDRFIYDILEQPMAFVGATLHLPSFFCLNEQILHGSNIHTPQFFHYSDADNDACAYEQQHDVRWFILDSGTRDWFTVTSWDELNTIEITNDEFPGSILAPDPTSPSMLTNALVIPEAALNKRIGFIYTPISNTGSPKIGAPIKVWDLSYYWGQNPSALGMAIDETNTGKKLGLTEDFSGGGVIQPKYQPPEIKDLIITSRFAPGEQLKAEYEFVANNQNSRGDYSRLWWGENNTITKAKIGNQNYSLEKYSPVITKNDMGKTLEVTVLPITFIEPFIMLAGEPVTSLQVTHPPTIDDLTIDIPLKIGSRITASYDYFFYNTTPESDISSYSWQLVDPDNTIEELISGVVTQSGVVEIGPQIELIHNGRTLRLVMIPRDISGVSGIETSTEDEIEKLTGLGLSTFVSTLRVGEDKTTALRAIGYFSLGTINEVTELGIWKSTDPDLIVDSYGIASLSPSAKVKKEVQVNFTYKNFTLFIMIEILPAEEASF
ncbi:hypothetical protein [Thorsellia anophelis]|uniref:Uncharacterized protein n=1 Tax=Thorsellia anophelis DSM 18579 TaxID=1123402 RepID=A0A1I0DJR8_9GAMM|nr:hypothetical protein [Thorsellia anophelis]SET32707.1 hypothetical protein SAMN02583745_02019 [Thorsellia anophelis DSM 18579]